MQAYQAAPCPYCGATWNQPGAQFCANCRNQLPAAAPAYAPPGLAPAQLAPPAAQFPLAVGKSVWYWAGGAVLLLLVLLLGIMPAVASGQINSAEQALTAAVSHQAQVDAAFDDFLRTDPTSPEVTAFKVLLEKEVQSVRNGLALVQADRSRLTAADQRLAILAPLTITKRDALSRERRRISAALNGLKQAERALTAGVNQGQVLLPFIDALTGWTKMSAALGRHDLVGAAAPYPEAQERMDLALARAQNPDMPPGVVKMLAAFNQLLQDTEKLVLAIQAQDANAITKYSEALQTGANDMAALTSKIPADYNPKTYQPMKAAYDAGLNAARKS